MPSKMGRQEPPGNRSRRPDRPAPLERPSRDGRPDRSGPGQRPTRDVDRRSPRSGGGTTRSPRRDSPATRPGGPPGPGGNRPGPRNNAPILPGPRGEILYGRNAVAEAVEGGRTVYRVLLADGIQRDARIEKILRLAELGQIAIDDVPRQLLDDLTRGANHQGVGLDASEYPYVMVEDIAAETGTVLVLDHLQDPQNLGTLLRAAEAAGVAGVVIPRDRAVAVTPAVVNASSGAVEHMMVAQVPNLPRALDFLKKSGRWVIGLDESATSQPLFTTELPLPAVLVVGGEASGIGVNVAKRCDLSVSLPMRGRVASLNAATAGSIVLFDLMRRAQAVDG